MTDMSLDGFNFDTASMGADAAKTAASAGGSFAREVEFLSLKGDPASVAQGKNTGIFRLLTEFQPGDMSGVAPEDLRYHLPWITAKQHYAPTKPRPDYAREGSTWPEKFSGGCRKDKIFAAKYGNSCYLCDTLQNKPSSRTWALAVEREQVVDPNTKAVLGVRDKTREVFDRGPDGKGIVIGKGADGKDIYQMKTVPAFVVMNMGWKNFFAGIAGQGAYFHTVLDSDFVITRTGSDTDSTYTAVRIGPMPIPAEECEALGVPAGTLYDLRNRDLMKAYYPDLPDLRKIIAERVSDDYLGRWFIPGWAPPVDPNAPQQQQQAPQAPGVPAGAPAGAPAAPVVPAGGGTAEAPNDALAALRARMVGNQTPAQ